MSIVHFAAWLWSRVAAFPVLHDDGHVKTTVDIPEPLYKRAKIRAVEEGTTLKDILLTALTQHLDSEARERSTPVLSRWASRVLTPDFEAAMKANAYRPQEAAADITSLIAEDRDAR
jgi:hypothetical protein